ncbi:hypothetical protein H8356DRAFT_1346690 [Neocallimastix lanati (nom. inval.)]|nr:hypothetical protein H8356DRAFT_1346690 [Neocallimastix sp. JGI-2020a]
MLYMHPKNISRITKKEFNGTTKSRKIRRKERSDPKTILEEPKILKWRIPIINDTEQAINFINDIFKNFALFILKQSRCFTWYPSLFLKFIAIIIKRLIKLDKPFTINRQRMNSLCQTHTLPIFNKTEFPFHFVSRNLKKDEKNYSITKQEDYSGFYHLLNLYNIYKPLVGMFKNVIIRYEKGKKNIIADAISVVVSSASSYIEDFMNSKINKEQYYKKGKKIRKVYLVVQEGYHKTYTSSREIITDLYDKKCQNIYINSLKPYPQDFEIIGIPAKSPFVKYIVDPIDYFTKWVEAKPFIRISSSYIIEFLTDVINHYGIPEDFLTFLMYKYFRLLSKEEMKWDKLPSALWALWNIRKTKEEYFLRKFIRHRK